MTPADRTILHALGVRLDALFFVGDITAIEYVLRLKGLRALEDQLYKKKGENL